MEVDFECIGWLAVAGQIPMPNITLSPSIVFRRIFGLFMGWVYKLNAFQAKAGEIVTKDIQSLLFKVVIFGCPPSHGQPFRNDIDVSVIRLSQG